MKPKPKQQTAYDWGFKTVELTAEDFIRARESIAINAARMIKLSAAELRAAEKMKNNHPVEEWSQMLLHELTMKELDGVDL